MRGVYICKKLDTFQKARQFALRFYSQKASHFALHDFHEIFEIGILYIKTSRNAKCDAFCIYINANFKNFMKIV